MELKDYPRPPKDTGIGVHWSPGNSGAVGAGDLQKKWIPQLQRMGVKWVKMLHPGGIEFAELLLEAGIMPVVRIYRHRPNSLDLSKAVLTSEDIAYLKDYLAAGVRYFEFNNEPELASEWEGAQLPPDAIDYVARAAIVDMETILGLGGYPAVPATAVGATWDLIGKIIEHGGDYLFDEPVWLAVHNYDINHPLNYPYDRVNRRGEKLSPETYRALGTDAWTGSRWGTRTLAFINSQRQKSKQPRADIHSDPSGFLAFQRLADLSIKHLGRHLPILSTENGPIVGEDDDPRYPTTTPERHAQKVAEIAEIMMGVHRRYDPAPDYYFCTAFWLMGSAMLRTKGWEGHSWFSERWPDGRLPAVAALETLSKRPRRFTYDEDERPAIPHIGHRARSSVSGVIYGYPNMRVILRSAGYAVDTFTDDNGHYRIERLPAGQYRLSVPGVDIVRLGIELDGKNHVRLDIGQSAPPIKPPAPSPSGWQALIEDAGATSGLGIIRVSVEGKENLPVRISAEGWEGYTRQTGSKPEFGPYALEFSPLGPGNYTITPEGLDVQARVKLNSSQTLMITFRPAQQTPPNEEEKPRNNRISGHIARGVGLRIVLHGPEGLRRETIADENGAFSFDTLPDGRYEVLLPDLDMRREITLAEGREATLTLEAPQVDIPAYSTISGRVIHGAGRTIMLKGPDVRRTTDVQPDESYLFDHLGPGQYYVRIQDTLLRRGGLVMNGRNHRTVNFAIPVAESADSVLFGQAPRGENWQLYVRGPAGKEIVQPLDDGGEFEIGGLKAGEYEVILQSPEAEFIERVTLNGVDRQEVTFDVASATAYETPETPSASWTYQVEEAGPGPGFGVIRVRIPHQPGLAVRLWAEGWTGMVRHIGDKPEYGPFVCEFAPLGKGKYYLQPAGMTQQVEVEMPGSREIWVTFAPADGDAPATPPGPPQPHKEVSLFILVKSMPYDLPAFIQTLRYAARTHPVRIGDDIEEALRAEKVIILASSADFGDDEEARLVDAGCQVTRIAPPYYATHLYDLDNDAKS